MATRDPELESFTRIDLVAFAKQTGYAVQPRDSTDGLTVLEHPNRDRVVVARSPEGAWIYASANRCAPRGPDETPAEAERRLRDAIARTKDKGTIVEFVQGRDWTARTQTVSVECVRERLRDYVRERLPLDAHGPLRLPIDVLERPRSPLDNSPRVGSPPPLGDRSLKDSPPDPRKEHPTRDLLELQRSLAAPAPVLVVTQSVAQALLYYEQQGKRLGHTNATASYLSLGAERPRGAGWDLHGVDKAMAAMPPGGTVVAALPGPPAGDRLAHDLRTLAARHPQVTFQRHTVHVERDKAVRAPDRHAPHRSLPARALGSSRDR